MFYASYGSFMHKLLERYYQGGLTRDSMLFEFFSKFSTEIKGDRPPGSIVTNYIKHGAEYIKSFEPVESDTFEIEKKVFFEHHGNRFVGVIDYLGEKDGDFFIVDHKSRDLKPRSNRETPTAKDAELDSMLRQLYLYSAAIKSEYKKFPKYLCFNCFRTGVFIREPFNEDAYNETIKWADRTIDEIKNAEDFYPRREFFMCKYLCGYNDICCYYQQTK